MEQPHEQQPYLQDQQRLNFGGPDRATELMNIDPCRSIRETEDSQLHVGVPVTLARDVDMGQRGDGCLPNMEVKIEVQDADGSVGKRKRGRPARGLPKTPPLRKKTDEEDVCFICFDGGSLVLCDRRGCPKAYHPACIKRDESFFRSKAKWNCGWHICSICQKASHYMCYTCTYSLCKGCTKDADFLCVRGNKGLCGICMKTIMLIENSAQGNKEMCEVDFDDKSSWEYLFKVYWMYLKGKLSLTLDELLRAKRPWKGAAAMGCKVETPHELHYLKDEKGSSSENSCIDIESNNIIDNSKRQPKFLNKEGCLNRKTSGGDNGVSLPECNKWASKELLEFVADMKNGDTPPLSAFDVQALLLEYVKKNNLRDPQQNFQIVCDSRLVNLFGKPHVGHFEMLKLLESHFLIVDNSPEENTVRAGIIDAVASQVEANNNYHNQQRVFNDKGHKTHKEADVQVPQDNLDEYAAINAHNINLIYLRRNQMENLIEDAEKFLEMVIGSIVRIRISCSDQKQEIYRLVKVVGTSKVAEPYNIGTRTTDIVLEILNLNRKEVISIDEISNEEFSEDECSRLRQSIKYGLVKRLTVGEILDKAMTLQAVRVNDLLEAEILRLNHLRDGASEKGYGKELREYEEELQLLNSSEERQRRLHEIPEIHSDPHMDSMFESDEDAGTSDERKQDDNIRSKDSGFDQGEKEKEPISSRTWGGVLDDVGCRTQDSTTTHGQIGNLCTINNQINSNDSAIGDSKNLGVIRSEDSDVALDMSSLPLSTGMEQQFIEFVSDKLWHYHDPTGNVQGPFSMMQLCKWNETGHFPPDLRIWRINEKQDDYITLTDALSGNCFENVSLPDHSQVLPLGIRVALDDSDNNQDGGGDATRKKIHADSGTIKQSCKQKLDDPITQSSGKDEYLRSHIFHSNSSSWTVRADGNHNKGLRGNFEKREESSKSEIFCHDQSHACPSPSAVFSEKLNENRFDRLREGHGIEGNSEEDNGNLDSNRTSEGRSNSGQSYQKQSDSEENSGQSTRQNWRCPPVNSSPNCLVTMSDHVSVTKTSPQNLEIDIPRPVTVTTSSNCRTSDFVSITKPSPNNPDVDFLELCSHTSKPNNVESIGHSAENKQSASSNVPVQDVGPSWSTASSLVNGGTPLPEVTVEWRGCSPAPPNPAVEEWDSNVVSASSLKPAKTIGDCAANPSSISLISHSPPSHQACNTSSWQAIISEPNDFGSLVDESVSDLLAEVEAMESLGGLESPTSIMKCGGELTDGSKTDCLRSADELSPMPDAGKGDALSSTADLQLPSQSTAAEEPLRRTDVHNHHRISGGHSSRSSEVLVGSKNSNVSGTQWESGSEIPSIIPSSATWDTATDSTWRLGSENTIGWEASQGNANRGWGVGPGTVQENRSINSHSSTGNPGYWGSQTRYGSDRYPASRDRGFQGYGRESGFGKGRTAWNRQPLYGAGNGGSYRPPAKGQRICKYYESGYCKKGASCHYRHP